ncbi:MAG: Uma2 family endonuclease [Chloroflexi bacterium]|nr:Uma2 family endonuclease [Chloroflexota bacterium]
MTTQAAATVVYPETDGMPLPDGEFQAPIYRRVVGTLEFHFADVPGAWVNGNTFIYYVEGNPRRSVSPDCYVVFNLSEAARHSLSIEANNTYLLWEVGKAPDFILEIGSKSTSGADLGAKRDLYAELGVSEYWRYDSTGGDFYGEPLAGERLVDGAYRRFELRAENDGRMWGHSDALNLDLWWTDGELRFWDPAAGQWLLSQEEERAGRLAAEARLAEMEAELRQLRGE